jgi:hypothetical protein
MVDIRRAIESLVPNAKWDFSIPNEGGTEPQYNAIRWTDTRSKPSWGDIVTTAAGFETADLLAMRQGMVCGPLQIRKALRQTGNYALVTGAIATADEEVQEAWKYASEMRRLDPMVEMMRQIMGKTDVEVDDLFHLAMTL